MSAEAGASGDRRPSSYFADAKGKRKSSAAVFMDTESADPLEKQRYQMLVHIRFAIIISLLILIILVLLDVVPLMNAVGEDVVKDIRDMGVGGGFLYCFICVGMVVICVPNSLLALAAGYTYQSTGYGFLTAWPGVTIGCAVSFWLGRVLFRDWLELEMRHNLKFAALSQATEDHGAKVVFFGRISPIPSGMLNYAFSVSAVAFLQYMAATAVGLVPIVAGYAKIGSVFFEFFETDELQKALKACKGDSQRKKCCDELVANTIKPAAGAYANSTTTACAVKEIYSDYTCSSDVMTKHKEVAQCLADACTWSDIEKEAGDLNCKYNDSSCSADAGKDNNDCLKDLNNSELWPLIVAPLALFFTLLLVGFFGHRALQRAGLLQVSYDLDRQRELLVVEREAEQKAMSGTDV